jgi:ubiquinone/menaquinone biosynthesis C-methylase UbiE
VGSNGWLRVTASDTLTGAVDPSDPAYAGQELYSGRFLRIYDPLVLGFNSYLVWRCPTSRMVRHYARHVGSRHVDIGPGTGYFLDRAPLPSKVQITLVDPNPDVLAHAARRLARLRPATIQADVLKPLPLAPSAQFDSVALNYVLHCLPGPPERKTAAVRHAAEVLTDSGVLFGATVLGASGPHTPLSRMMLWYTNRTRIFDNLSDSYAGIREVLAECFARVDISLVGTVAVFAATNKR